MLPIVLEQVKSCKGKHLPPSNSFSWGLAQPAKLLGFFHCLAPMGNPWEQIATANRSVLHNHCSWNCFPVTACLCCLTLMLSLCNYQQLWAEGSAAISTKVSNYLKKTPKTKTQIKPNKPRIFLDLLNYLLLINQLIMAPYHIQRKSLTHPHGQKKGKMLLTDKKE